jgi:hypothetical protein
MGALKVLFYRALANKHAIVEIALVYNPHVYQTQ